MSLDKAIEHGKERRKPYYGSKAVDPSCRNHGECPHCKEGRAFKKRKNELKYLDTLEDLDELNTNYYTNLKNKFR